MCARMFACVDKLICAVDLINECVVVRRIDLYR